MKAWIFVKIAIGLVAVGTVFFAGLVIGGAAAQSEVDGVRMNTLANCLPIESVDELAKCTGLNIVEGQP